MSHISSHFSFSTATTTHEITFVLADLHPHGGELLCLHRLCVGGVDFSFICSSFQGPVAQDNSLEGTTPETVSSYLDSDFDLLLRSCIPFTSTHNSLFIHDCIVSIFPTSLNCQQRRLLIRQHTIQQQWVLMGTYSKLWFNPQVKHYSFFARLQLRRAFQPKVLRHQRIILRRHSPQLPLSVHP